MKVYFILIICLVLAAFVFRGHILNFYSPNLTKQDIEQIALEVVEKKLEQEMPKTSSNSRLWTSLDGKTIEARLYDADYKSVKLLTSENKLFNVSIQKLSPSDQAIIKQFLKAKQEFQVFKPEKPHSDAELK